MKIDEQLEIERARRKQELKAAYADFTKQLQRKIRTSKDRDERQLIGSTLWSLQEGYKKGR